MVLVHQGDEAALGVAQGILAQLAQGLDHVFVGPFRRAHGAVAHALEIFVGRDHAGVAVARLVAPLRRLGAGLALAHDRSPRLGQAPSPGPTPPAGCMRGPASGMLFAVGVRFKRALADRLRAD